MSCSLIAICDCLGRALDFSKEIDDFVGWNRDLQALELDADDWSAISQVASWLKAFRSATTEMSWDKRTHAFNHACYLSWPSRSYMLDLD